MNEPFSIVPPPELVTSLRNSAPHGIRDAGVTRELWLINHAYAAGANQELEACCEWFSADAVSEVIDVVSELRAARRPKSPTLKEQALAALRDSPVDPVDETLQLSADVELIIRRALEALPND
jgi:hypothetical protein